MITNEEHLCQAEFGDRKEYERDRAEYYDEQLQQAYKDLLDTIKQIEELQTREKEIKSFILNFQKEQKVSIGDYNFIVVKKPSVAMNEEYKKKSIRKIITI